MDNFAKALNWALANPEISGGLLLIGVEFLSRKIPGSITFLHLLSKVLDKIPGLKNK